MMMGEVRDLFLIIILTLFGFSIYVQQASGGGTVTVVPSVTPKPFNIGDSVITTDELNVRDAPGTGSNIIKTEHRGTAGIILEGPQVKDGYAWWKVKYDDDVTGWSSDHRLEKYTRPSPKFSVGDSVKATADLNVRAKLGTDYSIIKTMPSGSTGTIQSFSDPKPRVVDGYNWWYIRWSDGTTGWSVDAYLEKTIASTNPRIDKTFSVTVSPGQSVEDTIIIYNPNNVGITVRTFTITDYQGFRGTVTALTSLPFQIPANSNGEIRVRITANSDCPPGPYLIRYRITGDPNNWEVLGD
jgi:uncharacterized protein YgiM (DUF1202 family)